MTNRRYTITDALGVTVPCSDDTIAKIREIGIDAFKEHFIMQLNIELAKYIDREHERAMKGSYDQT